MNKERESIQENKTWDLVQLPRDKNVVENKWVFTIKTDEKGHISRYKVRLVAKGYSQEKGFDYDEEYSPVVQLQTLRLLLSIALQNGWPFHAMDVKTAFLNGHNEDIYMTQPTGFEDTSQSKKVCKLKKALCGLKQASCSWNLRLRNFLVSQDMQRSEIDQIAFTSNK